MNKQKAVLIFSAVFFFCPAPRPLPLLAKGAKQQRQPHTPKPGSRERKTILDALRKPVEKEMKQSVVFYDVTLNVQDGWAYVGTMARDAKGRKLKRWAPQVDPYTIGLLRLKGSVWRVLSWGSATDVAPAYEALKKYPQAPRSIFPPDVVAMD